MPESPASRSTTRRAFIGTSLGAAFAAGALARGLAAAPKEDPPAPAEGKKLKILMLGGTGWLGPAIVDRALANGHTVTLFNRGKTNTHLYPELEKLRGNRGSPPSRRAPNGVPTDLKALEGRKWDVAIDTSCFWPEQAEATAGLLKDAVKQYLFISSISVYPGFSKSNEEIDEETSTELKPRDEYKGFHYGAFKALAEEICEKAMPGRVCRIRPGLIVGPGDPTDRFTYWPWRVDRGGEILAPGNPNGPFQVIDVRDLGAWCVHCAERGVVGIYNATGFPGRLSMEAFLHGCKCAINMDCSFTWVDEAFVLQHKVRPWADLPMWLPEEKLAWVSVDAAIGKGLTFRPIGETSRDTIEWLKKERGAQPKLRGGLAPEREAAVLKAWHARSKDAPPVDEKPSDTPGPDKK